jgi:release factor glutamine methyltransferase
VVSNPPYVPWEDRPGLQRELDFEPEMALFAAEGGLAVASELLRQAWRRGAEACVLEIGAGQGEDLAGRARSAGWPQVRCRADWAGHDRVLVAVR